LNTKSTNKNNYDLVVLGAGSGGVRAARVAANHGAKVAIIESVKVGGTCVLRGCVPKKLLVYGSQTAHEIKDAEGYGWSFDSVKHDWSKLIEAKNIELDRLNKVYLSLLESAGVDIIYGFAEIKGKNTVEVNGNNYSTEKILISVGAKPYIPNIKGRKNFISSDDALELNSFPKNIIIYGGGYISLEFAGIFSSLGSKVTIVYRGSDLLRGFDEDISKHISHELKNKNISIITQTQILSVSNNNNKFEALLSNKKKISAEQILCATGRIPNTEGLGLKNIGILMGSKGEILVNEFNCTNLQNIYAVGDVTNRINLTPVAIAEGQCFADNVFGNLNIPCDLKDVPSAVFSQPAIGVVGYTEDEAVNKFKNSGGVKIYKTFFKPMKQTLSGGDTNIMIKMIVSNNDDKVVGIHSIGDDMPEIIQMAAVAIKSGAKKSDFDATIGIHPTSAEEMVTMK